MFNKRVVQQVLSAIVILLGMYVIYKSTDWGLDRISRDLLSIPVIKIVGFPEVRPQILNSYILSYIILGIMCVFIGTIGLIVSQKKLSELEKK